MFKRSFLNRALFGLGLSCILGCGPQDSPWRSASSAPAAEADPVSPNPGHDKNGICSTLDFIGFSWPNNMFEFEKEGLQLALNITGSLEGPHGWQNLSNDFDGQGFSMGLMNQNLGTGSLQPLLLQMRDRYFTKFKSLFRADHFQSLMNMLSQWEGSRQMQTLSEGDFSPLDIPSSDGEVAASAATSDSVEWARKTVYDSPKNFNPLWREELLKLAGSPEYVSLQIDAAWSLHDRALKLHEKLAVYELRTYLLAFDIVVQNGNLKPADEVDYRNYVASHPNASPLQRLQKIVELRLRWVKPQYRKDVQSRKLSIITGSGVVHGQSRQYEREYCFNRRQSFPDQNPLP